MRRRLGNQPSTLSSHPNIKKDWGGVPEKRTGDCGMIPRTLRRSLSPNFAMS